jgi:hypothetical protein
MRIVRLLLGTYLAGTAIWQSVDSRPMFPTMVDAIRQADIQASWANGLLGAVGVLLLFWDSNALKSARHWAIAKAGFRAVASEVYKGKTIKLADLIPMDQFELRDKIFEDCTIVGPAVIAAPANIGIPVLDRCKWMSDRDTTFVRIARSQKSFHGCVTLPNCVFRRCTLKLISIMAFEDQIDKWLANGTVAPDQRRI